MAAPRSSSSASASVVGSGVSTDRVELDAVLDELGAQPRAEAVVGQAAEVVHVLLEPPQRARRVVRPAARVRAQLARGVRHEIDQRLSPDHDRHGREPYCEGGDRGLAGDRLRRVVPLPRPRGGPPAGPLDELVDGGLAALHERLVDAGTPPKAAGEVPRGLVRRDGRALGRLRRAGRGRLVRVERQLRWHVHPGGWADRLGLGAARALVAPGPPVGRTPRSSRPNASATSAPCGRWRRRWSR